MPDTQPIPAAPTPDEPVAPFTSSTTATTAAAAPPVDARTALTKPSGHKGRRIGAWVLVVLVFVLTPLTLASGWARLILANEKAYVSATSPLANEESVQAAIEDRVTTAVMTKVDSLDLDEQVIDWLNGFERMPDRVKSAAQALMGSLNQGLESVVRNAVTTVVTSQQFQKAWDTLQTTIHKQFTAIMNGDSVLLTPEGGLALQLQPVVAAVRQHLVDNGRAWAANIPDTDLRYDLLSPTQTQTLRGYYKLATGAVWVLSVLWVVVAVAAVLLALNRPMAIVRVAIATILGALLIVVGVRVVQNKLVADGADLQHPSAIEAIFRDVLSGLRDGVRITVAVFFVVALVAWLFSRGRAATAARRQFGKLWGPAADEHAVLVRRIVAGGVAVIVGVVLLFADLSTTWTVVLGFVLLAAVILALLPGRTTVDQAPLAAA